MDSTLIHLAKIRWALLIEKYDEISTSSCAQVVFLLSSFSSTLLELENFMLDIPEGPNFKPCTDKSAQLTVISVQCEAHALMFELNFSPLIEEPLSDYNARGNTKFSNFTSTILN